MSKLQSVVWPALVVSATFAVCLTAPAQSVQKASPPASSGAEERLDDRLEASDRASERLAKSEEAAKRAVDEFAAAVTKMSIKDFDSLDLTAETGLRACESLRRQFKDVADRAASYQKHLEALGVELAKAPTVQRELAEYYREQAVQATNSVFRQQYLKFAENCDALIPVFRERLKDLDAHTSAEKGLLPFLREGEKFFADAARFFKAHPGNTSLEERRQFREQLKGVSEKVDTMLRAFEEFNKKLKGKAVSSALRAEHRSELAAAESLKHSPASPLAQAKALCAEADELSKRARYERPRIIQAVAVLRQQGRHAEAERVWNGWAGQWKEIESHYARPTLTVLSATRGVANHGKLNPEGCYPLGRQSGFLGGYVRVVGRHTSGGYEVEAVEGQIQPGDYILVKVA